MMSKSHEFENVFPVRVKTEINDDYEADEETDLYYEGDSVTVSVKDEIEYKYAIIHDEITIKDEIDTVENKQFESVDRNNLYSHASSNRSEYKCPYCSYKSKKYLNRHIKQIHNEKTNKTYKCTRCPFESVDRNDFFSHNYSSHNDYKCPYCPYKGKFKAYLTRHMKQIHNVDTSEKINKTKYKCTRCPFESIDSDDFLRHDHSSHSDYKCTYCPYKGKVKASLTRHMKQIHNGNTSEKTNKTFKYKCTRCPFESVDSDNFFSHDYSSHSDYKCPYCPYKGKVEEYLTRHMKQIHNVDTSEKTNKTYKYKCTRCPFESMDSGDFLRHDHSSHSDYKCTYCPYKGKIKASLTRHMRQNHNVNTSEKTNKTYKCTRCPYTYKSAANLLNHIKYVHDRFHNEHILVESFCEDLYSRPRDITK